MARGIVVLFGLALAACVGAPRPARPGLEAGADCLGPADARHFAVYLHGNALVVPSQEERRVLAQVAQSLSVRFALPRGEQKCGEDTCWGWRLDADQRRVGAAAIQAAAQRCFPKDARFGLVGFSNGGYLALGLLRACELPALLPRVAWSLSVGSAMLRGPIEPTPTDLSDCGQIVMLSGDGDTFNNDPAHNYRHRLEAKHAQVTEREFAGGHQLLQGPLEVALAELLGP